MQTIDWEYGQAFTDGEVVRFCIGTKARPDVWAVVDIRDWPVVNDRKWHGRPRGKGMYVYNTGTKTYLHRLLMRPPSDMVVDHIDGDPLNNSRSNLQICTQADNMTFAGDRRRGYVKRKVRMPTKPHIVTMTLADGSTRSYSYPTRSKTGTVRRKIVKVDA